MSFREGLLGEEVSEESESESWRVSSETSSLSERRRIGESRSS